MSDKGTLVDLQRHRDKAVSCAVNCLDKAAEAGVSEDGARLSYSTQAIAELAFADRLDIMIADERAHVSQAASIIAIWP